MGNSINITSELRSVFSKIRAGLAPLSKMRRTHSLLRKSEARSDAMIPKARR